MTTLRRRLRSRRRAEGSVNVPPSLPCGRSLPPSIHPPTLMMPKMTRLLRLKRRQSSRQAGRTTPQDHCRRGSPQRSVPVLVLACLVPLLPPPRSSPAALCCYSCVVLLQLRCAVTVAECCYSCVVLLQLRCAVTVVLCCYSCIACFLSLFSPCLSPLSSPRLSPASSRPSFSHLPATFDFGSSRAHSKLRLS